jgi:hypothetical protein
MLHQSAYWPNDIANAILWLGIYTLLNQRLTRVFFRSFIAMATERRNCFCGYGVDGTSLYLCMTAEEFV